MDDKGNQDMWSKLGAESNVTEAKNILSLLNGLGKGCGQVNERGVAIYPWTP